MKRASLVVAMLLAGGVAAAQTAPALPPEALAALDAFRRALEQALAALHGAVDPWIGPLSHYLAAPQDFSPPEITPDGDILIRRRPGAPPLEPPTDDAPALDL